MTVQLVNGHIQRIGNVRQKNGIGHGFGVLPFGYGLCADSNGGSKLFLGQICGGAVGFHIVGEAHACTSSAGMGFATPLKL